MDEIDEYKREILNANADKRIINLYEMNKPYGCFSTFSDHSIFLQGKVWPTVEHYFQAQKFVGTLHEEEVRLASTPMDAFQVGQDK